MDSWYKIMVNNVVPVTKLFDKHYNGGIVLDVGGNVGAFTDYVINKHPDTEVHLFEPVSKFSSYLNDKYTSINNVNVNNVGLGDVEKTVTIKQHGINLGVNQIGGRFNGSEEEIKLITLDSYVKDNNIQEIGFIKIDVEFFEAFVFEGFKQYITNSPTLPIIVIEFMWRDNPWVEQYHKTFEWLFDYYEGFDYQNTLEQVDIALIPKWK